MKAARTAIGRVTLKAGGASVRVLQHRRQSEVVRHMRETFAAIASRKQPPDGYVVCAFWIHPESPGYPTTELSYHSTSDELPPPILCKNAAAFIAEDSGRHGGADLALKTLGYEPESWEPEPAA
jgi:hypothetical protein